VELEAGKIIDVRATVAAAALPPKEAPKTPDKPVVAAKAPEPSAMKATPPSPRPIADAQPKLPSPRPVADAQPKPPAPRPVAALPRPPKEDVTPAPAPTPKPAAQPKKDKAALADDDLLDEKPAKAAKVEKPSGGGDGYLRLGSKPWTNISVDGKESGLHTRQTQMKLSAGSHRITLSNPQFNIKETFSVDIKAGETATVIKDLRSQGQDSD
jgi:hypothetical protein